MRTARARSSCRDPIAELCCDAPIDLLEINHIETLLEQIRLSDQTRAGFIPFATFIAQRFLNEPKDLIIQTEPSKHLLEVDIEYFLADVALGALHRRLRLASPTSPGNGRSGLSKGQPHGRPGSAFHLSCFHPNAAVMIPNKRV